jgi:hypothetical protein
MTKVRNDFKVYEYRNAKQPDIEKWQIRTGLIDLISTFNTLDEANRVAAELNKDPYYLERGNTQLDRANMQAPHRKD